MDGVICKAISAQSSCTLAIGNKGSCRFGYEDPDTCGYDNSCDANGNRTWDGVVCSSSSAVSSAIAIGNKSSCSNGYEDPDTCGYDNSCDCNGNRTWDGVICKPASTCNRPSSCTASCGTGTSFGLDSPSLGNGSSSDPNWQISTNVSQCANSCGFPATITCGRVVWVRCCK